MTPQDPTFANYAVSVFVLGLIGIAGLVAAISTVYKNLVIARAARDPARTPPLAEQLARDYATKVDLAAVRREWQEHCAARRIESNATYSQIFELLRKDRDAQRDFRESVARQLGSIEESLNILKKKVL